MPVTFSIGGDTEDRAGGHHIRELERKRRNPAMGAEVSV
jgi:hypothetical protein